MAVAHECQLGGDGASSLDSSLLGILDCFANQGDREVAGLRLLVPNFVAYPIRSTELRLGRQLPMVARQGQS